MQFYKEKLVKLNAKKTHIIDEVVVPYSMIANDFQKWTNESITWGDYVSELSVREIIMTKLREKCTRYDLSDSTDFFVDLMANLQLDSYVYKSLRNSKGRKEFTYASERTIFWLIPLKIEIKCEQKKQIPSSRTDSVYRKMKHKYLKMEYNDLEDELDPVSLNIFINCKILASIAIKWQSNEFTFKASVCLKLHIFSEKF